MSFSVTSPSEQSPRDRGEYRGLLLQIPSLPDRGRAMDCEFALRKIPGHGNEAAAGFQKTAGLTVDQKFIVPPDNMKCHEIFSKLSPKLTNEIFAYLLEFEKPVYKAMIQNLATRRKLRPVFIERKPKSERHVWLHQALSLKSGDDITIQLLQIWLLGAQREMICEFLDSLGIEHDGKGVVENLPSQPSREKLEATITSLLEKRSPEKVTLYLHAFQAMDETGWSVLDEILSSDPRVALPSKSQESVSP